MSDIVERLRSVVTFVKDADEGKFYKRFRNPDGPKAADEIERLYTLAKANNDLARRHAGTITALRAEVEMLRDLLGIAVDDHDSSMGRSNVPAHWSNRARAALTQTKDTTDDA